MFSVDVPQKLANPVRKIVFAIESRDQGWGGELEHEGTYHGSWTWFEAGIERLEKQNTCKSQARIAARPVQ